MGICVKALVLMSNTAIPTSLALKDVSAIMYYDTSSTLNLNTIQLDRVAIATIK